jgi:hypothetical protein
LKGAMLGQLTAIFEKPRYQTFLSTRSIQKQIDEWIAGYEGALNDWGKEVFQIRSKLKSRGASY